jgi:hypothetical protein
MEQGAWGMEQGARSMEHGARSKEHGARSKEQGAQSKEHRARSTEHEAIAYCLKDYFYINCIVSCCISSEDYQENRFRVTGF